MTTTPLNYFDKTPGTLEQLVLATITQKLINADYVPDLLKTDFTTNAINYSVACDSSDNNSINAVLHLSLTFPTLPYERQILKDESSFDRRVMSLNVLSIDMLSLPQKTNYLQKSFNAQLPEYLNTANSGNILERRLMALCLHIRNYRNWVDRWNNAANLWIESRYNHVLSAANIAYNAGLIVDDAAKQVGVDAFNDSIAQGNRDLAYLLGTAAYVPAYNAMHSAAQATLDAYNAALIPTAPIDAHNAAILANTNWVPQPQIVAIKDALLLELASGVTFKTIPVYGIIYSPPIAISNSPSTASEGISNFGALDPAIIAEAPLSQQLLEQLTTAASYNSSNSSGGGSPFSPNQSDAATSQPQSAQPEKPTLPNC